MFYRLLLNYFRLKLLQFILTKLIIRLKSKNLIKSNNFISFLELFLSHYMNKKIRK
ncbi:hypothetical protein Lpar_0458 [Legionella parisiensis]|uniref:Uncharacterized protein n=1 Tax=Legionella parisiensis TaxID=45071 RepID=A0A1E5JWT5_9GAMM|nr:hypothetical protein Lpar_0458 [Legionella parisiensis]OEH48971.1 hypothetical protein lpari_00023 [Legionella parisiensis]STX71998.1 Uncharacterised protein [Legionella parisiensis]